MKGLDWPPIWLLLTLAVAWIDPLRPAFGFGLWPGLLCLAVAAALTLAAVLAFAKARTTIVPRRDPAALITTGIFGLTRNPIYLADVLILAGLSLVWGSVIGLLLVPVLARILQARFITGEERRLEAAFGKDFTDYAGRTRRWL